MSASVRKLAKQTVVYGLSSIVPRFLNFLLVPLYTYFFDPSAYGIVADLYSWAVLLNIVVTYGMETAVFRFSKNDSAGISAFSTAFYSVLISSFCFLIFVCLYASRLAESLGYASSDQYIVYFGLIIFFDAISAILFVKLRLDEKAFKFSSVKILNVLLNIFFNLFFILFLPWFAPMIGLAYKLSVSYIFVSNLLASVGTFLLLVRLVPSPLLFDVRLLRRMIHYGIPLMLSGVVGAVNDVIDRQFIKFFSPPGVDSLSALGIYFANLKLAVILVLFVQAFRYAAEPFFFRHADDAEGKNSFARVAQLYVGVSMFVFLFTYANLSVFKYFIGSAYWSGLFIVPVILLANVFAGLYLNFSMWYKLADKTYMGFLIILVGCVFTVLFDYLFVPLYGYVAAAVVRLLSYVLMTVICYYLGQRYYRVPYKVWVMFRLFFIAVVLFIFQFYFSSKFSGFLLLLINNVLLVLFVVYFVYSEGLINSIKLYLWPIKSKLKL